MENISHAISQSGKRRNNSDDATETETHTTQRILSATTEWSAATSLKAQPDAIVISDHTYVRKDTTMSLRNFTFRRRLSISSSKP